MTEPTCVAKYTSSLLLFRMLKATTETVTYVLIIKNDRLEIKTELLKNEELKMRKLLLSCVV